MQQALTIEQCRPYLLGILRKVDAFCRENGIRYSLGYGSLIGAIRHGGFIPWDDDIDILMPRADYDRFVAGFKPDGDYRLMQGQEIANHLHAVVTDMRTRVSFPEGSSDAFFYGGGLWVDIFPLDNVTSLNCYRKMRRKIFRLRRAQLIAEVGWTPHNRLIDKIMRGLLRPVLKPFSGRFTRKLDATMRKHQHESTPLVSSLSVWYWRQKPLPREYFENYTEVEFEGIKCQAISNYDEYLRGLYGDYMQLPPEEARVPKHQFKAYLR